MSTLITIESRSPKSCHSLESVKSTSMEVSVSRCSSSSRV